MFEIKQETPNGTFHVKLNRSISATEILELAQIAANITRKIEVENVSIIADPTGINNVSFIGQTKLGEKPVPNIKMGEYKEPESGIIIRMLAFPEEHRVDAVKLLRDKTGLPILSARDIVYGNYPCPILEAEIAYGIMEKFRGWNIYAKLEQA
jgi:ribosomal protein L7/L12